MDPIFSEGDIALLVALMWVTLAGMILVTPYLLKEYSTASEATNQLFSLSGFILVPGAIILIILAYITNQINQAGETELSYYKAIETYSPILAFFDKAVIPVLMLAVILGLIRRK